MDSVVLLCIYKTTTFFPGCHYHSKVTICTVLSYVKHPAVEVASVIDLLQYFKVHQAVLCSDFSIVIISTSSQPLTA